MMLRKSILLFCFCLIYDSIHFCFAQQPKLMLPIGHRFSLEYAQFSPDGKKIVTASNDASAKIWDAASGYLLFDLTGHHDGVSFVQYSPDGKKVLTSSYDSTACIWDAETGKIVMKLEVDGDGIRSANFSPDGKKIVAVSMKNTAEIRDAVTGNVLAELKGHSNSVWGARFSPDGKMIVTYSSDSTAKIWDAVSGKLLNDLKAHNDLISSAEFSPDGKKLATSSGDKTAIIWDLSTAKPIIILTGHKDFILSARFSPDGNKVVTASADNTAKIWDAITGKLIADLKGHSNKVNSAVFSQDNKTVLTASGDMTSKLWDAVTGQLLFNLKGHSLMVHSAQFSPDGKKIVTASEDNSAMTWDAATGKLLTVSAGHTSAAHNVLFSPDSKKIISAVYPEYEKPAPSLVWDVTTGKLLSPVKGDTAISNIILYSPDGNKVVTTTRRSVNISDLEENTIEDVKIWDVSSGKLISMLKDAEFFGGIIKFSPDQKKLITVSGDNWLKLWDVNTGKPLAVCKGHMMSILSAEFTPDGKRIMTASNDISVKIWDAMTGKLLKDLTDFNGGLYNARLSPDGKKLVTTAFETSPRIWDFTTYKPITYLKGHSGEVVDAQFSPDGKKIITASEDSTVKIWDATNGKILITLKGHAGAINTVQFSPDNKKVLSSSYKENNPRIWDASTGKLIFDLQGHNDNISDTKFSPDGKYIASASKDNTIKKWDAATGKCLYTFFAVDKNDYLVVDNDNHYDGTEAARKLLYFVCGTEIVDLAQVKDQLWVPDLAERINKGETINAKTLDELNICGLTPLVEEINGNPDEYYFTIKPRRGGLGDISLSINGAVADTRKAEQLTKNGDVYEFRIIKNEFIPYLPDGQMNTITLKAYTADNTISSRTVTVSIDKTEKPAPPPNLYAVMVGVSDYKGDGMDLDFAAIDATDVSSALKDAAGKLLGKEHVFMYNLTTAKEHYMFPEKNSIKKVFEEIGKKATANDILFIFFSGHGVMEGEGKKQFYYMTADASGFDAFADAGISTAELTEWIKPQNIKAQKRILILDACHSGQAINDFVKLGDDKQGFLASKGDDKAQQVKAIDKLNEKSGLFILSASAGDKLAFESQAHSHGYLTYSLLKTIKQQPDILEDGKFLNISRWFNAAGKTVDEVSKEEGVTQQTQIVTNTDFNIGLVDDDVTGKIKLSEGKQLFSASNFQNSDVIISDDDLDLGKLINAELASASSKGAESKIMFIPNANSPEAFRLSGRYLVKGNSVTVTVNIRQNKIIKSKFVLSGTIDKLEEVAVNIVNKAAVWVEANKKP